MKKSYLAISLLLLSGCSAYHPGPLADDITKKALSSRDKGLCEALKDERDRTSCISAIVDSALTDIAFSQGNATVCGQIQDSEYKKACELAATTQQRKQQKQKEEDDKLQKAQSGNVLTACDALDNLDQKAQCRENVIITLAHQKKDKTICLQVEDKTFQKICQSGAE